MKSIISSKNQNFILKKKLKMNHENNRTPTDQEIMNILTSPEWQDKPFTRAIVNRVENDEIQVQQKMENKPLKSRVNNDLSENPDQAKISIDKNDNIIIVKESFDCLKSNDSLDEQNDSCDVSNSCSSGISSEGKISHEDFTCSKLLQKTKSPTSKKDKIFENFISDDQTSLELFKKNYFAEDFESEKRNNTKDKGFPSRNKDQDSVDSSQLRAGNIWVNKILMRNLNTNSNNFDSDAVDSSSTWSIDTPTMSQVIHENKSREYVIGTQTNDESPYPGTMEQAIEKTKLSLGKLLIEGIHKVSERYRHDPFRYLGQWLLVQADIRDENMSKGIIDDEA